VTQQKSDYRVLIADDYQPDLELLAVAMKAAPQLSIAHAALNGEQTIDYLKGNAPFNDRELFPLPQLLLLDLKMPGIDGFGVLHWLQTNPIPNLAVFVLTGTMNPTDEIRARAMGADAFFKKQPMIEQNRETMRAIQQRLEARREAGNN